MAAETPEPEIKVTDRRRFTAEGEALDAAEEIERAPSAETEPEGPAPTLPPANFEFLVLSLRWQAEMQLGLYRRADDKPAPRDIDGARHSIDLLGVVQQKTRGNLSLEEQRLLDNSLTELRFRYLQAAEQSSQKP